MLHIVDVFPTGQHQLLGNVKRCVRILENNSQIFMPNGKWFGGNQAIGDILKFNHIHSHQIVCYEIHITFGYIFRLICQLCVCRGKNTRKNKLNMYLTKKQKIGEDGIRRFLNANGFTSTKNFVIFMIFSADAFILGMTTSISIFGFEKNTNADMISLM